MPRPTKYQIMELPDVAQSFRWEFESIEWAETPIWLGEAGLPSGQELIEQFDWHCTSSEVPRKEANQPVEILVRGHGVRRPGIFGDQHTMSLTFFDTVDSVISAFFEAWREACWGGGTGIQQPLAQIRAEIVMNRLNQQDQPVWAYRVIGCYPEDVDPVGGELGADPNSVNPTIQLYYDTYQVGRPPGTPAEGVLGNVLGQYPPPQ